MGFNIERIKFDAEKETNGVWVDYLDGSKLLIARLGNPIYTKFMQKIGKPFKRQIRKNQLDDKTLMSLSKKAIVKTILLDWKGFEEPNESGKLTPVRFTPSKALEYFEEYSEFFKDVVEISTDHEIYYQELKEESVKN